MSPTETSRRSCETGPDPDTKRTPRLRHRRRSGRAAMVTVLAVAAVGVAGMVAYRLVRDRSLPAVATAGPSGGAPQQAVASQTAAKPPAERAVSTAPDKAEIRTPMVLLPADEERRTRPVVALGRPEGSRDEADSRGTRQGLLERELIRQAVLIAARDELGLSTRDELLDDAPPGQGEGPPLEIATLFRPNECHALVRRGAGEKAEVLLASDLGTRPDAGAFLPALTVKAEALSRTELPALLKRLGLKGEPNKVRDDAPVPREVEDRLEQLGLADQIAAVRALHEAIRADGESPARLSAMARGYAQLGVLTEYQWDPAHRAFKARAMLYAHRLIARDAESPFALRSRAFVRALVGRHELALADLDRAKRRDEEAKGSAPPPSWLPLIEAYLKCDRKRLAVKEGPHARLAALLAMLSLEYPHGTRLELQAARELVELDPDCCRGYELMTRNGQLNERHVSTLMGPAAFAKLFPTKLKSLPSAPPSLKKLLDQGADESSLVDTLDQAGLPGADAGEPCWGVLAHLAREARFMYAMRRLLFMARFWHVPAGEYLDEVRPLVARHRYYPYLQYLAAPAGEGRAALIGLADRLDLAEIEVNQQPMVHDFRELKLPVGEAAWGLAVSHASIVARDFAEHIVFVPARRDHFGRVLLTVSPYSAYAMGVLIENAWDQVQGEIPAWREKVGDAPALIGALGKKMAEKKQYDEAEKDLRRYIELSPDPWAYQSLADGYKARGDLGRWKEALDEFLAKTEPAGLEHAQVQVEIADALMAQKRWAEAKPYAEAAAETWAGWAMICASRCNEGLGDWARAELWIRRTSERYTAQRWADWYLFCARTGHGDLEAARRFALDFLAPAAERADRANPLDVGFYSWASGSPKTALAYMQKAEAAPPTPKKKKKAAAARPSYLGGMATILLADELGDTPRRDRLIEDFATHHEKSAPRIVSVVRMLRDALADGGRHPLDLAAVDKALADMPANTRGNAEFLIGRFLINRRQPESARKYLKDAVDSAETNPWLKVIAADSLRSAEAKGRDAK